MENCLISCHSWASLKDLCLIEKNWVWLCYFLAKEIFMAFVCVILKPCSASRAAPACTSFSNSTKAMSWRPGTKRTSLNPGNLGKKPHGQFHCEQIGQDKNVVLRCYWLVEEHGEHEFVRLLRQVGEEEDMIGRVFWNLWGQKGNYSQNNREKNKLLLFLRGLEDLSDSNHTHYLLRHLSRHLSGHHPARWYSTRRHLARGHPWRGHHVRRGHVRRLAWHVHHARSLAHSRHSLKN